MDNNLMEECVVTFNNGNRKISMYFTDRNGNLEVQMSVDPELKENEEPDLVMLLASTFMTALNTEDNNNDEPEILVN